MAAGINDKFKKVSADNSYAVATTVKTARTVGGGTTLEAFDLSKWADQTAVNFLTYRKTTDPVTNITTVTNRTGWTALVNTGSNTLTNLTIAPGYTDLGHQVGDYIEPVPTSKWANDLVDGILTTHNQDGTLKNKVATLGKIHGGSTDGVLLTDASGNVTGGKVTADKLDFATLNAYSTTTNQSKAVPGGYTSVYYENHTKAFPDMPAGIYELEFHTPYWFPANNVEVGMSISSPTATRLSNVNNTRTGSTDAIRGFGYVSAIAEHPGGSMVVRVGASASSATTVEIRAGLIKVRRFA